MQSVEGWGLCGMRVVTATPVIESVEGRQALYKPYEPNNMIDE